jgi:hypothetical protein
MFSTPSYGEWTKLTENVNGNQFYVDFERIRKHDGYVYFWSLGDYLKPLSGVSSYIRYYQGDCKLFRHKSLSFSSYKEPMGGGTGKFDNNPSNNWSYPIPNSVVEVILKTVCSR